MSTAPEREDLQAPADPGVLRAYALALLVHLLLAAALTWGVSWKSQNPDTSFSAELWSATPQEAAPPLAEPPPPVAAEEPPPPTAAAQAAAAAEAKAEAEAEAEIALQKERQRKRQQAEAVKKAELADKLKAEKLKAEKEKADKARKAQESAAQAKATKDAKATKEAKEAKESKDAKAADAKQQAKDKAAAEKLRQQNIARMMGMAGGTGAPDAKGTAAQASGPSDSYAGRVRARIKPNVVFTEQIEDNPVAEVEVRASLDGTIISQRLIKSSGNKAWDDAVIKAIIRTEVLPRDVDGRVPTPLIISFRPRD